jgi:methionyl aminopeptidase
VLHSAEDDKPRLQRGKVAPELPVPEHIPRPPYAANYSHPPWTDQVMVHNQEGVAKMRESCRLAARVLQHAGTLVKVRRPCRLAAEHNDASADGMLAAAQLHSELMPPGWPTTTTIVLHTQPGVTTDEIDQAVHQMIVDNGAYPSPLRYGEALRTAEHTYQQVHATTRHAYQLIVHAISTQHKETVN